MPTDSLLHLPADARARAARWALFGAALTAIAVGDATLLTVGLGRGWRLLASALLVYVSSAWLWVATVALVR